MKIEEHVSLSPFTTFKVGGKARYFCKVGNLSELKEALSFARAQTLPLFILGGGSNILISDSGFSGLVIQMAIVGVEYLPISSGMFVVAGAGEVWDKLVSDTISRGLGGLENLSGIPGTVGATPIQNVGAYGAEVKDSIEWVEVFDNQTDKLTRLNNSECRFEYRGSFFKTAAGRSLIITRVAYKLFADTPINISYKDLTSFFAGRNSLPSRTEVREAVLSIRARKFPDLTKVGTAGSFFKNPIISKEHYEKLKMRWPDLPGFKLEAPSSKLQAIKLPLAWILDNVCKLKGFKLGNVGLHDDQPLVLVNLGNGTADEIKALAKKVVAEVKKETGIELEWEVQVV